MKHLLLLIFFLAIEVSAQHSNPIAESNYYVYNRSNYGFDVPNPSNGAIDSKGRYWTKSYIGKYKIVENSKIKEPFIPKIQYFPEIQSLFRNRSNDYLCTSRNIFVLKNDTLINNIQIVKKHEEAVNFVYHQNKIYYRVDMIYDNKTTSKIYCYDFKNIYKIFESQKFEYQQCELFAINGKLYVHSVNNNISNVFEINNLQLKKIQSLRYHKNPNYFIKYQNSLDNYIVFNYQTKEIDIFKNYQLLKKTKFPEDTYYWSRNFFFTNSAQIQGIYDVSNIQKPIFHSFYNFNLANLNYSKTTNSYYAGNGGNLIRFFPHVKKYSKIFNNTNSAQVFTMSQTPDHKKWFGSYNGFLSIMENNKIQQAPTKNLRFLNGNIIIGNKLLLFTEGVKGNYLFSSPNQYQKILEKYTFFYAFKAKNGKYYFGSMKAGLFEIAPKYFERFDEKYIKIKSTSNGLKLNNIITISEDKFGNIWMGQRGTAVYNPRKNRIITWHTDDNPSYFGALASLQDSYQNLWFGSTNGELIYYDGKNADDLNFKNFKKINHPLLKNNPNPISFLHQWKNFLIIGAADRILLFDIGKWSKNKEVMVRYLNTQETNFSSFTEQNTVFTDKQDESVWFSTSDMVYQWDIKKWLKLPKFKIKPLLIIKKDSTKKAIISSKGIKFEPTENSFDFEVHYQTPDNLPRYLNCTLVKKGEKPQFEFPNVQTSFHFANLSSGDYIFYVRVCQQDGSFEIFEYPILIDGFIWQKWWFWALISLIPIGFAFYYYREKSNMEQTKKKLAQLNLASLSNQFRPHFMLNALNSIASQMGSIPNAEKVISKLGDSINILYRFSQKNEFTHDFLNEWKLVENFIEIQKVLYLPELEFHIKNIDILPKNYRVPVGLIQIPVENALLHGLRNKDFGSYELKILFSENESFYIIEIEDNGIGIKRAEEIHRFRKNGRGLKTINSMIEIINQYTHDSISFEIKGLENDQGTKILIKLYKDTDYGKIKI